MIILLAFKDRNDVPMGTSHLVEHQIGHTNPDGQYCILHNLGSITIQLTLIQFLLGAHQCHLSYAAIPKFTVGLRCFAIGPFPFCYSSIVSELLWSKKSQNATLNNASQQSE